MSQQALVTAAKSYDLDAHPPAVDWSKALGTCRKKTSSPPLGARTASTRTPLPQASRGMIERTPNDPAWYKGGLWNDSMRIDIPGLWLMTWYDVSAGPNLAAYNYVRKTASPAVANEQYAIIAPMPHCSYKRATEHTIVGERDLGDARLDYDALTYGWFDRFLKGEDNGILAKTPKVQYYTMGLNKWQSSDTWPPARRQAGYLLPRQRRPRQLARRRRRPRSAAPPKDSPDKFVYDPMNPVPTHGGGFCCMGADYKPGASTSAVMEARDDVLVYTHRPARTRASKSAAPSTSRLYVSSDAKDTDFTVKLIDVLPDGTAYNIDDNIQRARYREGYDKPPVWMEKDKVYKVTLPAHANQHLLRPRSRASD